MKNLLKEDDQRIILPEPSNIYTKDLQSKRYLTTMH
jgi:hypothetical protein